MPRSDMKGKKRITKPDLSYHSVLVTRFIHKVMERGKLTLAEKVVYGALERVNENKKESLDVLKKAMENVMPRVEIRPKRVGGATYQVPIPVRHDRSESLAIRWILAAAKSRKGLPTEEKLFAEIKEAASGLGAAVKKREAMHKMAEANKAFAHLR